VKQTFSTGRPVATPGTLQALESTGQTPIDFLNRHLSGDWGNLERDDWNENAFSLINGFRLFSAYALSAGTRLWVITEADRSATTFLLPSEY
jgi:hypothetical protein